MLNYLLHTNHRGYALSNENLSLMSDTLKIKIEGVKGNGAVYLFGAACPTKQGEGEIPTALLRQGENPLTYVEEEQRYTLDPLQRCGNIAYVKPIAQKELLALFLSFAHLSTQTLQTLEERLTTVEQQIAGYSLFRQ